MNKYIYNKDGDLIGEIRDENVNRQHNYILMNSDYIKLIIIKLVV
jgi:hypothetical protein